LEAAAAGLGVAACPLRGAQKLIAAKRLVQLNVYPKIAKTALMLVYRQFLAQHPRLVALRDALKLEFSGAGKTMEPRRLKKRG
jgi:DNA-binding transcriptional LysR family regulator